MGCLAIRCCGLTHPSRVPPRPWLVFLSPSEPVQPGLACAGPSPSRLILSRARLSSSPPGPSKAMCVAQGHIAVWRQGRAPRLELLLLHMLSAGRDPAVPVLGLDQVEGGLLLARHGILLANMPGPGCPPRLQASSALGPAPTPSALLQRRLEGFKKQAVYAHKAKFKRHERAQWKTSHPIRQPPFFQLPEILRVCLSTPPRARSLQPRCSARALASVTWPGRVRSGRLRSTH